MYIMTGALPQCVDQPGSVAEKSRGQGRAATIWGMLTKVPFPCWVLGVAFFLFVTTWLIAPRASNSSAAAPTFPLYPPARNAPGDPSLLGLSTEHPPVPMPRGPEVEYVTSKPWQIALTFDDGPHQTNTERLLDILDKYGVKATFFVNGCWLEPTYAHGPQNREILQRARRSGHIIGNHSYSHPNFNHLTRQEQTSEILRSEQIIYETVGIRPTYFRFPYAVKTESFRPLLHELGYVEVRWNASGPDDEQKDPSILRDRVMLWLRHYQSGIVMLHDRHRWSVAATELLLQSLQSENVHRVAQHRPPFQVVPLDIFLLPRALAIAAGETTQ
jgi:peptidoglycan-N-acetylglucosamine deacetylase